MMVLFSALIMFMSSLLNIVINNKHFLLVLLCLEFIMLSLFLMMGLMVHLSGFGNWLMLFYLFLSVCEACLGVGLLIWMSRVFGGDYFYLINLLN